MASNIDPSKPTSTMAYTADVRANFATAADEITVLQTAVAELQATIANMAGGITGAPSTDDASTGGSLQVANGALGQGGEVDLYGGNADQNNGGSGGSVQFGGGQGWGAGNRGGFVYIGPGTSGDGLATAGALVIALNGSYVDPNSAGSNMVITGIPTVDPGVAGAAWLDPAAGFALKLSQG